MICQQRWNRRSTVVSLSLSLSSILYVFRTVYYSSKLIKRQSPSCPYMLRIPVYLRRLSSRAAEVEDMQWELHLFCLVLHCVTTELKGGICDLISPGNIKEKQCFIHRHKAPEFTQIKFARLCLRDQAWGLTHIEMIGFLRLIKEEGGRECYKFRGGLPGVFRGC